VNLCLSEQRSETDWAPVGEEMHALCRELFPICRSITGDGVRDTLRRIGRFLPDLAIHEVPSGTRCFDWVVPPEWNIRDACIIDPAGERIVDFKTCNLHVVSYSVPVDQEIQLTELQQHLHSLPELPDAIPYVTSYYSKRWGFCLADRQRRALREGTYRVKIDSTLAPGSLTYAELLIPGQTAEEVFFSTYVCHPSLGNNELSGPVVATFLARKIAAWPDRRYSYRFVFVPETIGSITYLSRNLDTLKRRVVAGFNITCIGDERCYSYLPSRGGNTLSDRVVRHVLRHTDPDYKQYSFLDRGSDERQYCSPGIDLPVATLMRSKYGTYPEYHTSLDDLDLITPDGLAGGLRALERCVLTLEANRRMRASVLGEPQMGKRGLYPTLGTRSATEIVATRMNLLAYADGNRDLLEIAETIDMPVWDLAPLVAELTVHGLLADGKAENAARKSNMTSTTGVADHYDAVAGNYHKQYERTNLREAAEYPANYFRLQILINRLSQSAAKSVYEVGVGEGTPLAKMAAMGFRVAGCDIADAMVAAARSNFEKQGLDPSTVQWGDIEDSTSFAHQLSAGRYDAVIAAGVLPHVRNDRLFLDNIGMIVRSGGRVFVEFRNKLFSLFTLNRYTKEFIVEDLLRDVTAEIKDAVVAELDQRLAVDLPPVRRTLGDGGAPGYDMIPSKFHNPFELLELFQACGYRNARIHWYHYHPAPPLLETKLGAQFRNGAMALEHEGTWRGYFLCSAGVIEAQRD